MRGVARRIRALGAIALVCGLFLGAVGAVLTPTAAFAQTFGLLSQVGSAGTGNGQYNGPLGVAVDSGGNVYVVDRGGSQYDTATSRVVKFSSSGNFESNIGNWAPGVQPELEGVAVNDSTGDVYVTVGGSNTVEKFDSSGNFKSQFGGSGSGNGQFNGPWGVAVNNSTGDVYVVDAGDSRVEKFDSNGNYLSQFGTSGTGNGQFDFPQGVAVELGRRRLCRRRRLRR